MNTMKFIPTGQFEIPYGNTKLKCDNIENLGKTGKKTKNNLLYVLSQSLIIAELGNLFISAEGKGFRFLQLIGSKNFFVNCDKVNIGNDEQIDGKINVVSGCCLFSMGNLSGISKSGDNIDILDPLFVTDEEIVDFVVNESISLYEADYIYRIVKGFLSELDSQKVSKLVFQVPYTEYYLYLLDYYNKGLLKPEQYEQYMEIVDKRGKQIKELVQKRLPKNLQDKVNFESPIEILGKFIKNKLKNKESVNLDELLDYFKLNYLSAKFDDELVDYLYENITSFKDIAYLSYVLSYLELSMCGILVAVEDSEEYKIIMKVKSLIKSYGLTNKIIGLYLNSNFTGSNGELLYFSKSISTVSKIKEIIKTYLNSNFKTND